MKFGIMMTLIILTTLIELIENNRLFHITRCMWFGQTPLQKCSASPRTSHTPGTLYEIPNPAFRKRKILPKKYHFHCLWVGLPMINSYK